MAVTLNDSKSCNLLRNTNNIRNICIMAHVDHGKTTLADSLIASNGIISPRLAGKLRYMDSRQDEQERGITMKSSCISLYQKYNDNEYLINLIDSPGHVDFSGEVSTAVRLCDGAVILVDVIEGVCSQTISSLKHAWTEKLKPVLVLNKLDRLIMETKMPPMDAYLHLTQILEQVNSVTGDLFRSEVLEKCDETTRDETKNDDLFSDWSSGLEEADDSNLYFSPAEGNVIFGSAIDGWGFTIEDFAEILYKKCGFSKRVLQKTLWGNYYLDSKSKQVKKGAQEHIKKPLFVKMILENIWQLYETVITNKDREKAIQIIDTLKIDLKPQQLRFNDPPSVLRILLSRWIPLSSAVLNSVCKILPPPNRLSEEKIDSLMFGLKQYSKPCAETLALRSAFLNCSQDADAPVIVFISKMFPVERKHLPENRVRPLSMEEINARRAQARLKFVAKEEDEQSNAEPQPQQTDEADDEVFIAFARIYSGVIRAGCEVFVLGPKHDPKLALQRIKSGHQIDEKATLKDLKADEHITRVRIDRLYLLMGRELEPLTEVTAGNVFGVGGLEEHVMKSATLSTEIACPAFTKVHLMATPILRVAVEPENPAHLKQLAYGLKLLNQADSSVQVLVQDSGEHVLVTTGEVHLQRCVEDLRLRYAKVPVLVSEPIIPFRETVVPPPKVDMVNEAIVTPTQYSQEKTTITIHTTSNLYSARIQAIPLPPAVVALLEENTDFIKFLTMSAEETDDLNSKMADCCTSDDLQKSRFRSLETRKMESEFKAKLVTAFNDRKLVENIWSFGPKLCGPNILFNAVEAGDSKISFWQKPATENSVYAKYESNFVNGFQLATLAGPLCEEPMMGVGFVVHDWWISEEALDTNVAGFSGQLMLAVKDGCRRAFQAQPQRLMAAMYSCNILVNTEVLGRMYAVLNKRHGRILHGDLAASSGADFNITAFLPVAESFKFASEVRKQTSGLANPQLVFSHWEVLDLDPFWTPSTDEEYLLYGEKADSGNYARAYMNAVRKRKGLPTDEKIVEHAEKQRTLSKNK